jgi:diguanylate cyclase (GGDEF)-like protein
MSLEIDSFILTSSTEVKETVLKVRNIQKKNILIHIVSYMHNTVLVQNLKLELEKALPHAKIVLINHDNKTETYLLTYSLDKDLNNNYICDEVLRQLHLENSSKENSIKEYRNQLFKRYFTDNLTNLPNVYQLRKDLDENEDAGLVIISLDNFKTIHNFYGFVVGDFVVEEVSKHLKNSMKEQNVYKLSEDEFAVILEQNLGFYELKEYLDNLYNSIKNISVKYQQSDIHIDLTLGSCSNTNNQDMFSKVSMALKYAKDNRIPFWIYEDRMHFENEYERNLQLSGLVREAVEDSRIVPYFQSILDNKTSKVIKYECLARLIDKNNQVLSPLLFIPVAKKIKVYNAVTKTIIDKSFVAFENSDFSFNINLSIEDIMSSEIFNFIIDKLKNTKTSSRVTFEILESEAVQDFKRVDRFISEIRRYGAKIAIDDFGSGYSNFSYLTKMNPDFIKIDGSLIKDIDVDRSALLVVETIVDFAKKLGIKTIAEYVHSSTIMDKVKELDIDCSQGFYIDEPSVNVSNKFL